MKYRVRKSMIKIRQRKKNNLWWSTITFVYCLPCSKACWSFLCRIFCVSSPRKDCICLLYPTTFVWRGFFCITADGKIPCCQDRKAGKHYLFYYHRVSFCSSYVVTAYVVLLQLCCSKNNKINIVKELPGNYYQLNLYFGTSVFSTCIFLPQPAHFFSLLHFPLNSRNSNLLGETSFGLENASWWDTSEWKD